MAVYNLLTDGQPDAAAPLLRGALVEALLDMGQFVSGDAGAVVTDGQCDAFLSLRGQRYLNALSVPPVFRGVVEDIEQHLLEPLRIALNERDRLLITLITQFHALLGAEIAVREHRVLHLRGQVHELHIQREASVLDAGKFQQLRNHLGQPPRLLGDDAQAAAALSLDGVIVAHGFCPAHDGRQGGTQLVADRGDKFRLDGSAAGQFPAHLVDAVGQVAELVVTELFGDDAIAPLRDAPGLVAQQGHGSGHRANEVVAQQPHRQDRCDSDGDEENNRAQLQPRFCKEEV